MKLPQGFLVSSLHCGIRRRKPDLAMIYCQSSAQALGFFTSNANVSYSVTFSKKNIKNPIRAVLVNSGNANCFSHKSGLADTRQLAASLSKQLGVSVGSILVASTGIIGKQLPKQKVIKALPLLTAHLGRDIKRFASTILTTDTFSKVVYAALPKRGVLLGVAKGAGMIAPNLATMLGFVLTDVALPVGLFKRIAREAVDESFNSISVDGCQSTNDTVFILSSRKKVLKSKKDIAAFARQLKKLCLDLAKQIVADGEGATKLVEIQIKGAKSSREARQAASLIADSNLVKCALYGQDANWGRIIAALGAGGIAVGQDVKIKASSLKKKEIVITVDLKRGGKRACFFTADLTPQYVKINAEYN